MSSKGCRVFITGIALAMLAAATWPHVALANDQDARAAAKAKVEQGAALLNSHEDARALAAFEEAYRIFPSPKIFFDIGLANVGLTHNPQAVRAFQRFLIEAPDASVESVTRAKAQVQALLPKVAIVDVSSPQAGMEIIVDDESVGRSPLTAPLYLEPGRHRLAAKANGTVPPSMKTFDVTGGTRTNVTVPVPPPQLAAAPTVVAAAPVPPSPQLVDKPGTPEVEEKSIYARPWFWAAAAGVAAAVGVTLLLTVGKSTKDPTPSLMAKKLGEP